MKVIILLYASIIVLFLQFMAYFTNFFLINYVVEHCCIQCARCVITPLSSFHLFISNIFILGIEKILCTSTDLIWCLAKHPHYSHVTWCRLRSPTNRVFVRQFVRANIKGTSHVRIAGPLHRPYPITGGFHKEAGNAKNFSISWRRHGDRVRPMRVTTTMQSHIFQRELLIHMISIINNTGTPIL